MKQPDPNQPASKQTDRHQVDSKQPELNQPLLRSRAFELDVLRGLALLMMMLHHFIFDLRYLLELDVFAFQETWWFEYLLRPVFVGVFLLVSGICCTFSRSNVRRGLKLLAVAAGFTVVTTLASIFSGIDLYIFFNVLHLLALGTLLYAAFSSQEKSRDATSVKVDVQLLILAAILLWGGSILAYIPQPESYWLLPLGLLPADSIGMGDYMPIIPWLGLFLIGALIGRRVYAHRGTAFPGAPAGLITATRPLSWLGRHSLWVYALHQPLILAVLYGLRALKLI